MAEPYDLRSNIKGKQGSQGTLFQVKDKGLLNPEQRWPRGYTPERKAEVSGALSDAYGRPTEFKAKPSNSPQSQRARFVDTVARSTIPADHLSGISKVDADPAPNTVGTYWPRQGRLAVDLHSRNEDDQAGQTLIHELGHHHHAANRDRNIEIGQMADRIAETGVHSEPYRNPAGELTATGRVMARQRIETGVHEGAADNYMTEHYRTRGRNPQPVSKGAYEQIQSEEAIQKAYPGYRDIRPKPQTHLGPQFHQETLF